MHEIELHDAKTATYTIEIEIAAKRDRVWKALVEEIGEWWLTDFQMLGPDSKVTLEPRAGGMLLESVEGGGSLAWFTVQMCLPGESFDLVGDLSADFGGPATTLLRLGLADTGEGTRLTIKNSTIGRVNEDGQQGTADCWLQIFRDGLKAHVEKG